MFLGKCLVGGADNVLGANLGGRTRACALRLPTHLLVDATVLRKHAALGNLRATPVERTLLLNLLQVEQVDHLAGRRRLLESVGRNVTSLATAGATAATHCELIVKHVERHFLL